MSENELPQENGKRQREGASQRLLLIFYSYCTFLTIAIVPDSYQKFTLRREPYEGAKTDEFGTTEIGGAAQLEMTTAGAKGNIW